MFLTFCFRSLSNRLLKFNARNRAIGSRGVDHPYRPLGMDRSGVEEMAGWEQAERALREVTRAACYRTP